MKKPRPVRVLLIEDSPGDIILTTEALEDATTPNELTVISDGAEAMSHLRAIVESVDCDHVPDLVLLDLNLPKVDGHEILSFMKRNEALKVIPVVVLTSSAAEADTKRAYIERANAYVVKPVESDDFDRVARLIDAVMDTVRFPTLPPEPFD